MCSRGCCLSEICQCVRPAHVGFCARLSSTVLCMCQEGQSSCCFLLCSHWLGTAAAIRKTAASTLHGLAKQHQHLLLHRPGIEPVSLLVCTRHAPKGKGKASKCKAWGQKKFFYTNLVELNVKGRFFFWFNITLRRIMKPRGQKCQILSYLWNKTVQSLTIADEACSNVEQLGDLHLSQ